MTISTPSLIDDRFDGQRPASKESDARPDAAVGTGPESRELDQTVDETEPASRRRPTKPLANHQVLCPSRFRDQVEALARRNGVTPSELVDAAMLLATPARLDAIPDPGEPEPDDIAVSVVPLASGQTRTFRRKPCLKVRGVLGLDPPLIRRLLAFTLALDDDQSWRLLPADEMARSNNQIAKLERRVQALIDIVRQQHPNVTEVPPRNLREATALMGFPNEWCVDETNLNKRFREMARVFHPDTGLAGCDQRMHSIIEARRLLLRFINNSRPPSSQY